MANRWWVYQRERFPVLGHGPLIAAFSFSAVCFSALLRGQSELPSARTFLVAFGTAFLFFLQLRIADEFKDFDEDSRFRPYRPVPRGLVSLRELAGVFVLTALVQFALALWLAPSLLFLLAPTWTYLALMSKEFFAAAWLKKRHILYMLSHMAIVPLVDFYATACDWWPSPGAGNGPGRAAPRGLIWFVVVSYFNGLVIEIGRKVRGPQDEEVGVNTYSALWGMHNATFVWLGALFVTAGFAATAAYQVDFLVPVVAVLIVLLATATLVAARFLREPATKRSKRIETFSGIWTLLMYLSLGAVPLLWRVGRETR
ncbi:MAG: UbiA family prenyltransferase [Planctomycetes bacterium]|nr:UbiA family prenyltransferase [Planctomycetota bacterium]